MNSKIAHESVQKDFEHNVSLNYSFMLLNTMWFQKDSKLEKLDDKNGLNLTPFYLLLQDLICEKSIIIIITRLNMWKIN